MSFILKLYSSRTSSNRPTICSNFPSEHFGSSRLKRIICNSDSKWRDLRNELGILSIKCWSIFCERAPREAHCNQIGLIQTEERELRFWLPFDPNKSGSNGKPFQFSSIKSNKRERLNLSSVPAVRLETDGAVWCSGFQNLEWFRLWPSSDFLRLEVINRISFKSK